MRLNHFCDQRIKLTHQRPSCFVIMLKRSLNQRACVRIIHVVESVSTPLPMTGNGALRLQLCVYRCSCQAPVVKLGRRLTQAPLRYRTTQKNVTGPIASRSSSLNSEKSAPLNDKHQTMKRKLLAELTTGQNAIKEFSI